MRLTPSPIVGRLSCRMDDEHNFRAAVPKQCVHCVPVTYIGFNMSEILYGPFEQVPVPSRACFATKKVLSHIVVYANDVEPLAGEVLRRRGTHKSSASAHNRHSHRFFPGRSLTLRSGGGDTTDDFDQPPLSGPGGMLGCVGMDCSPSLDQAAGLFPASFGQRGPCAADRSISSIGALLPIALLSSHRSATSSLARSPWR